MIDKYPSERAMQAAVEMEVHATLSTQTIAKGYAIDKFFPGYDDMYKTLVALEAHCSVRKPETQDEYRLHAAEGRRIRKMVQNAIAKVEESSIE